MIVWVTVVLKRTVIDSDCQTHQGDFCTVSWWCSTLVIDLISQLQTCVADGRLSVKPYHYCLWRLSGAFRSIFCLINKGRYCCSIFWFVQSIYCCQFCLSSTISRFVLKVPVFTISNDDRLNDYVAEQHLQTGILRNALHIMLSYYAYSILSHS